VRDRRRATVAQHTEREGKKQAIVAWPSLGLGLGIYIESKMIRQCVLHKGNE